MLAMAAEAKDDDTGDHLNRIFYLTKEICLAKGLVFLYNLFGGIINPSWVSLMGDIIPDDQRGRYFGIRNRTITSLAIVLTIIIALFMNWMGSLHSMNYGFMIIFTIAGMSRITSSILLHYHYTPYFRPVIKDRVTFRKFYRELRKENFGFFTLLMCLISLAQWIAGPFFGIFMLQILQFDYHPF